MSIRKDTATKFADDWKDIPALAGVRVIATERELDDVTKPTALIRQKTIARTPEAPQSHRNIGLLVTFISSHTDLDKAADQLDAIVAAALDYLDLEFRHEEATAVGYASRLAYDLPFTVIASKE